MNSYNGFSGERRMEVHRWLRAEERAGRLTWPTRCEACGQTEGIMDCHHENYDEPLSFVGLCYRCHLMLHCRFRSPEAWKNYCDAIMSGVRYAALYTRDFGVIIEMLKGESAEFTQHAVPSRDVFKEIGVKK